MRSYFADANIRKRLLVGVLMVVGLVLLLSAITYVRPASRDAKPALGLMTTLPLQWSEGGIEAVITEDAPPHPVYARLQQAYAIVPVDEFTTLDNRRFSILLLAQPRAFSAAELVKLDGWVRAGGKLLILADPALQWGSLYSLGDNRRPLFTSLLSPLFSHWGLEMVLPMTDEDPVVLREVDGRTIRTQTPGEWQPKPAQDSARCVIDTSKLLADCSVGEGRALLVADADLLDAAYWEGQGVRLVTGNDEFANMAWIEALLNALDKGR